MQFLMPLEPVIVASPVITDLPQVSTGLTRTLSTALIAMHAATTPDQHAVAVDAALVAAVPMVQKARGGDGGLARAPQADAQAIEGGGGCEG